MATDLHVIDWLLQGDPAIRWQTLRDLNDASPAEVAAERAKVATEGWGARLLAEQADDGRWGNGLYGPKWVSTHYTLTLLERLGLEDHHPAAERGTLLLVEGGLADPDHDACVIAMVLKLVSRFVTDDALRDEIVGRLAARKFRDGGWNCDDLRTDTTHSSVHTTISALEGLTAARNAGSKGCDDLMAPGREFLLRHRLYRSHTTGEVIRADMTRFSFPPRWWFDVLRGLEHFAAVDHPYDERLEDAIALVEKKRLPDGTWKLQNRHTGRTYFEMEQVGEPSRWNTLRAMRVLRWWSRAVAGSQSPVAGKNGESLQARDPG